MLSGLPAFVVSVSVFGGEYFCEGIESADGSVDGVCRADGVDNVDLVLTLLLLCV